MTNQRDFKAKVRTNVKDGTTYYSMQIPKRTAEFLELKKGQQINASVVRK